jgi:hypothetical protein
MRLSPGHGESPDVQNNPNWIAALHNVGPAGEDARTKTNYFDDPHGEALSGAE